MGSAYVEHPSSENGLRARGSDLLMNGDSTSDYQKQPVQGNDPTKPWIVQKFGGTSVGKAPDVIAGQIVKQWLETHRVVAVFSARSGESKLAGTTNR